MPAALILSLATLLACGDKDADDSGEPGDGGTTDGGTSDGGTTDGGTGDGGTTDGGTSDGGTSDGGTTDGGTTDGGTTDGGTTDGGTTDGGTSEYGSGTVTITDLVDPTGVFSASWEVRSAGWHMSTDPLELWIIDAEAGTIELIGDVALDPLSLNSHAADPCLGFEALLEASAALVAEVRKGGLVADHCEAVDAFLVAMEEGDVETGPRTSVSAYVFDLLFVPPRVGTWTDVVAYTAWRESSERPWEAWSVDDCAFSAATEPDWTQVYLSTPTLHIDAVGTTVVGSLEGTLYGDGASGELTATFEAQRCEYDAGPVVLVDL